MLAEMAMLGWFAFHGGQHGPRPRVTVPKETVRPLVVVDPGHGGIDSGSRAGGVSEAAVNLDVARALARSLTGAGDRVLLTRSDHGCRPALVAMPWARRARASSCRINLRDRVLLAVHHHASAFLSVHTDLYGDASVRGPRTYYIADSPIQEALAADIQRELDAFRRRPMPPLPCEHFALAALRPMPAATVEVGFLSNPTERRDLQDPTYVRRLADAITRGVQHFATSHPLLPPPNVDASEIEREWQSKRGRLYRPYRDPGVGHVPAQSGMHVPGCV